MSLRLAGSEMVCDVGRCRERIVRENIFHAVGINPPFGDEAVGGQPGVQRAFGDAVAVRNVAPGDGAESHEIEMRVFQFQRIERPFDQANVALQRVLALKEFQAAADALVLVFGQHGGHVRVQEWFSAARAGESQCETHHFVAIECAEDLAAGVMRDYEYR